MKATRRFYLARWMLTGVLFGACFPLIAWRVAVSQGPMMTFAELHTEQPVMWVVDLAPSILGMVGLAIGSLHARLQSARRSVEAVAHRIATSWTAELHRANLELVESLDERQRFYAAMSHELRTPLSAIVGYSSLGAESAAQPPEMNRYMSEIYSSATVLLEMVNDLLEAAKLDRQGIALHLQDIDPNEAVRDVASRLEPLALQKGLALVTDLGAGTRARADAGRLRQVLNNLITNAIKYTDHGTITVRTMPHGDGVEITVEDTGVGLEEEDLEAIFLPYRQTEAAVGRRDSTGLGLYICKTFADGMSAQLYAHSAGAGHGSRFMLILPPATGAAPETIVASFRASAETLLEV